MSASANRQADVLDRWSRGQSITEIAACTQSDETTVRNDLYEARARSIAVSFEQLLKFGDSR